MKIGAAAFAIGYVLGIYHMHRSLRRSYDRHIMEIHRSPFKHSPPGSSEYGTWQARVDALEEAREPVFGKQM